MILPTVQSEDTKVTHIVKDQHSCICGFKYNVFATFTKRDLKKIQFKPNEKITCPLCKASLNKSYSLNS